MKRVPYDKPLFIQTFDCEEMGVLLSNGKQRAFVEAQLESRYFAENPDNTPTYQEVKWGIKYIDPESAYWTHFTRRIPSISKILVDDRESNRAVITIDHPNPPCFQSFQFKVNSRGGIDMTCFARSLDLINGMPIDAAIFWSAGVVKVCQGTGRLVRESTLTIVSAGAHTYQE